MQDNSEILYDFWYVAGASGQLPRGKTLAKTMLGRQLLLGRTKEGEAFALLDFCPHRGIPLRFGTFNGEQVQCCYHGWCFDKTGRCTDIPSLAPDDNVDISRIKAVNFPVREHNGIIWVYVTAPKTHAPAELPALPTLPGPEKTPFYHIDSVKMDCSVDHAVIGLMDPAHGPYVHASWWWRGKRSMHLKQKHFEPTPMGFKMASHKPSSNSRAYRLLVGGDVRTEISFQLPSLRSEHIKAGKRDIVLLTALTPIDEKNTELHQFFFTDIKLLNALKGIFKPFGKAFIQQDAKIVKMQQLGLVGDHPSLMLLGDADQQALWYFKLKKNWREAKEQASTFTNTLKAKTLSWRS
jgi:phenylpropionate dioxygenase-like ring-hydroxylating dioxygenase large terminal subunit